MTQTHSKSRQQAEFAFGHIQTQFFAKDHALEELDFIVQAGSAKPGGFVKLVWQNHWKPARRPFPI